MIGISRSDLCYDEIISRKDCTIRTGTPFQLTIFVALFCAVHLNAQIPASQPRPQDLLEDLTELAARSPSFTPAQVRQLQAKVNSNGDDVQSRARLLGFYFLNQDAPGGGIAARREQILWMIHNRPEDHLTGSPFCEIDQATDADGYWACKALWKQISEKPSPPTAVLQNAVRFFISSDPRLAEDILKRATTADPDNPIWHQQLAEIYSNPMPTTLPAQENARRALEEMEKAFVLTKAPEEKFYILTDLPKTALACGENVKTVDYARQLMADAPNFKKNWNYSSVAADLYHRRLADEAGTPANWRYAANST